VVRGVVVDGAGVCSGDGGASTFTVQVEVEVRPLVSLAT
jgi:hypothetical protein